jgi:glycosyltransferase involved in cell wall biosynthesis
LISIILPVRNEGQRIKSTLEAIFNQDYPQAEIEIWVADGMSTDCTREIIRCFQQTHPNLYLIDNPGKIVSTGINTAIRQAKGEVIIRVDGHTIIANEYVRQCVALLNDSSADNVGGRMTAEGDTPFGKIVALTTSSPFGVGGAKFHYSEKEEWVDTVYMGAWRREVFNKVGLFDEELVRDQDDEFNYRLREAGGKILLSPKIQSRYAVRSTPRSLWTQYFQYGYWKIRVFQKHPKQMRVRQFIPPTFSLALLASCLSSFFIPNGWLFLTSLAVIYLVANLGASCIVATRKGWSHFPFLPITFGILHIGYGLGFLLGLLKFWNRWADKLGKTTFLS